MNTTMPASPRMPAAALCALLGACGGAHSSTKSQPPAEATATPTGFQRVAFDSRFAGCTAPKTAAPASECGQGTSEAQRRCRSRITRGVRTILADAEWCYHSVQRSQLSASGTIVVQFVATVEGTLKSVAVVSNDTGSEPLACCLVEVLQSMRVESGSESVVGAYPFVFAPSTTLVPMPPNRHQAY